MRAAVLYKPGDIRSEDWEDPRIVHPGDAVIRVVATCVCGSDLWLYRGVEEVVGPRNIGHEYVGVVEEIGSEVTTVKPGDYVVGSFAFSDNTCPNCRAGFQTSCTSLEWVSGAQAEYMRIGHADGTLVATPGKPDDDLIPSLLAASDVFGTGWFGARAAEVAPGRTVAVVGDGAVGLLAILSARHMGAERIIAMSRHADRQALAREFGATDVVAERGDEGVAQVKDLTGGFGVDCVIEAVGTQESIQQAVRTARPGGHVGFVGVAHGTTLSVEEMFFSHVHVFGGGAPVREYLPHLIDLVMRREVDPGRVFDLELPLSEVAEAYRAMDERRAIKTLLRP